MGRCTPGVPDEVPEPAAAELSSYDAECAVDSCTRYGRHRHGWSAARELPLRRASSPCGASSPAPHQG